MAILQIGIPASTNIIHPSPFRVSSEFVGQDIIGIVHATKKKNTFFIDDVTYLQKSRSSSETLLLLGRTFDKAVRLKYKHRKINRSSL